MKEWLGATRAEDVGEFYDGIYTRSKGDAFIENRDPVLQILRQYSPPRSSTETGRTLELLDAGCGSGQFIESVLSKGILSGDIIRCSGIEISRNAYLAAAERLYDKANIMNIAIEKIDASGGRGRFDYVTCLGVLEHTMNPVACFSILMRCLKPGAILLITVPIDFENCFGSLKKEPSQQTNERFADVGEWLDYFGRQQEDYMVLTDHVAIIYRKEK